MDMTLGFTKANSLSTCVFFSIFPAFPELFSWQFTPFTARCSATRRHLFGICLCEVARSGPGEVILRKTRFEFVETGFAPIEMGKTMGKTMGKRTIFPSNSERWLKHPNHGTQRSVNLRANHSNMDNEWCRSLHFEQVDPTWDDDSWQLCLGSLESTNERWRLKSYGLFIGMEWSHQWWWCACKCTYIYILVHTHIYIVYFSSTEKDRNVRPPGKKKTDSSGDKELVLAAVRQEGMALEYASEELKASGHWGTGREDISGK